MHNIENMIEALAKFTHGVMKPLMVKTIGMKALLAGYWIKPLVECYLGNCLSYGCSSYTR